VLGKVVNIINSENPVHVSVALPLYFVCKHAKKESVLMTGQGADELFGGYARYLKIPYEKLNEVLEEDYQNLISDGIRRDRAIAESFGLRIAFPYLDDAVIRIAKGTSAEEKIKQVDDKKIRKYILRQAAIELGLPENIANREKKAAQYGSGVMNLIKKMAKEKGSDVCEIMKYLRKSS
jgi:asparagine synthase (glutamine-hydrolysing)